ncbi:DUF192 domain-containing protein [Chitinophaga nivalis]|uniref:DUF192 domain-containing protein n=1 Tax=Chitinophaga nivalis TaxID=2991709 RepID=A0ABT3INS5_9BACT|nr:DUF192 domain-containing protein [Chitinophaga nivalis]MCW3464700.1 DUF192 domain-containing protein [Chitinophaga nivalis]MCW3485609.1 DUF192 domain-containing protein [Chitinophaga nivalis]
MQLHLKCILMVGISIAGCQGNQGNNSDAGTTTTPAAGSVESTEQTTATSNGNAFKKEASLVFIAKSGTDTLRKIDIQLAQTDQQREDGLMYRKSMTDEQGMLFIFPDMEERSFWMKNTYISLDIIYIDDKMEIVSVQKYATPLSEQGLPSYKKAKYVLEVNGGFCDKYHISYGDKIAYQ